MYVKGDSQPRKAKMVSIALRRLGDLKNTYSNTI